VVLCPRPVSLWTWCRHTPLECIGVISPSSSQALDTTFDRLKWNEQNRIMSDLSFRKERLLETETHVFPCCFFKHVHHSVLHRVCLDGTRILISIQKLTLAVNHSIPVELYVIT